MKLYLAAPFFNPPQLELVQKIEALCSQHNHEVWSPRQRSICPPDAAQQERSRVFNDNKLGIAGSDVVLAVLDYATAPGVHLRLVGEGAWSPPIKQPDQGVVWELGFAAGTGVPSIGFLLDEPTSPSKLNLMLAQTLVGLVYGFDELTRWLKEPLSDNLRRYSGRII